MVAPIPPRSNLFAEDQSIPRLDRGLVGKPLQDAQVNALVERMRRAQSEAEITLPLATFAKNAGALHYFPLTLKEFATTGSLNALRMMDAREITILLKTWGVGSELSLEVANRAQRLLTHQRVGPVPGPERRPSKVQPGIPEKRKYLKFPTQDLHIRDGEQLAKLLKQIMEEARLTPTEMAAKTGISRSQVYNLISSKSLPRKHEQLERFLSACQLDTAQVEIVLAQWRRLDQRRRESALPKPTTTDTAPPAKAAETIRVDGPNGSSITITGPRIEEADRKMLAELLKSTAVSEQATKFTRRTPLTTLVLIVIALCLVVLVVLVVLVLA
jgi:hypothetical protein